MIWKKIWISKNCNWINYTNNQKQNKKKHKKAHKIDNSLYWGRCDFQNSWWSLRLKYYQNLLPLFICFLCCVKEGRDEIVDKIVDNFVDKWRINFLGSLYFSLLFSRKWMIKFSEVALVSIHCNCLISWIMMVGGY